MGHTGHPNNRPRPARSQMFIIKKPNRKKRKMLTRHHDKAKSLGGSWDSWNIYKLSADHHAAYHKLFGLRTFAQAAEVLKRMETMHREHLSSYHNPPRYMSEDLPGEIRKRA